MSAPPRRRSSSREARACSRVGIAVPVVSLALLACGHGPGSAARDDPAGDPAAGEAEAGGPRATAQVGDARAAASPDPRAGPVDLAAALAAARAVELPDEEPTVDFQEPDAVFMATGSGSFVETLSAQVEDAAGQRIYSLELRTAHRADPPGFHARRQIGGRAEDWNPFLAEVRARGLGELGEELARIAVRDLGLEEDLEVIRIGDRHWTRSQERWSGPHTGDAPPTLGESPVRRLSGSTYWPRFEPLGEEAVNGRPTVHYRVTDAPSDPYVLSGLWRVLTSPMHMPDLEAGGTSGSVDLWVQGNGLVVRAVYDLKAPDGRVFRARLEATAFGEPVEIRPPQ